MAWPVSDQHPVKSKPEALLPFHLRSSPRLAPLPGQSQDAKRTPLLSFRIIPLARRLNHALLRDAHVSSPSLDYHKSACVH